MSKAKDKWIATHGQAAWDHLHKLAVQIEEAGKRLEAARTKRHAAKQKAGN